MRGHRAPSEAARRFALNEWGPADQLETRVLGGRWDTFFYILLKLWFSTVEIPKSTDLLKSERTFAPQTQRPPRVDDSVSKGHSPCNRRAPRVRKCSVHALRKRRGPESRELSLCSRKIF